MRPFCRELRNTAEKYRTRYEIGAEDPALLGPEPPPGNFEQRHERRQTAAAVLEALDELDIDRRERPAIERPTQAGRTLVIEQHEAINSIGWEP